MHFAVDPERGRDDDAARRGQRRGSCRSTAASTAAQGNPPNPTGHRTAYLWERVWQRDAWLDLLARFVHVEMPVGGVEGREAQRRRGSIFPRFHQWDAVLQLEADARAHGAGQQLPRPALGRVGQVEHDRLARAPPLDAPRRGRREGVRQGRRDHRPAWCSTASCRTRSTSSSTRTASSSGSTRTRSSSRRRWRASRRGSSSRRCRSSRSSSTRSASCRQRRYAVIVDEAHSSQTGEAAKDLKARARRGVATRRELDGGRGRGAGGRGGRATARTALAAAGGGAWAAAEPVVLRVHRDAEGADARAVRHARTRRRTATRRSTSTRCGRRSRRASSSTCSRTTRPTRPTGGSRRRSRDDPEYDTAQGASGDRPVRARCTRTTSRRRPRSSSSTSASTRAHKIGGKAKAMVVTSVAPARRPLQAGARRVHPRQGLRRRARARRVLRARSIDDGRRVHRAGHERLPRGADGRAVRRATTTRCSSSPRSTRPASTSRCCTRCTWTRRSTGLHAVQTLSRLNRIHPEKTDTFVLDFRNDAEEIQEAFEPYYDATVAIPTDPNLLYDTRRDLDAFDVLRDDEVENAARLLASLGDERDHGKLYALLDPAVERFKALAEEQQDEFRDALSRSSTSTRSSPRSSRSPTRRSSATTSTRARSRRCCPARREGRLDLGQRSRAHPPAAREDVRGIGLARPRRGRGAHDLRRARPAARAGGRAPLADHRDHQRAVRPQARPTPTSCCSTSSSRPGSRTTTLAAQAQAERPRELPARLRQARS